MDLLGRPLDATEERVLALYQEIKGLLAQPELAPAVRANLKQALAACWNIVNDLDLVFEQVYEYGV